MKPSTESVQQAKRSRLLAFLGGKCVRCGVDDARFLQIDHVHGDGAKCRATMTAGAQRDDIFIRPDRYQLLCANCNWAKRVENNEARGRGPIVKSTPKNDHAGWVMLRLLGGRALLKDVVLEFSAAHNVSTKAGYALMGLLAHRGVIVKSYGGLANNTKWIALPNS